MKRAFLSSFGSSDTSNLQAAFNGGLLSTHVSGQTEVFFENISSLFRTAGERLGRRLLEVEPSDTNAPIVNGFNLSAGPQADTQVFISFTINDTI
jgi:hypothetical protein